MIHSGNYVHPGRGFSLAVDQGKARDAGQRRARSAGGGSGDSDQLRSLGCGAGCRGICQGIQAGWGPASGIVSIHRRRRGTDGGEKLVSVGIDPDFTDGQARKWGEAIVHLALTPVPVVPDQDQFVAEEVPNGKTMPNAEDQMPNEGEGRRRCRARRSSFRCFAS